VAEQRPSLAGLGRCRQGPAPPRNRRQDNVPDRLLSAQRAFEARTLQRSRPLALGRRKSPALAARCRHERGSGPQPSGKRSPQSRRSPPHGHQRHAKGGEKGSLRGKSKRASSSEPVGTKPTSPGSRPLSRWIGPDRACFFIAIAAALTLWFWLIRPFPLMGFIGGLTGSRGYCRPYYRVSYYPRRMIEAIRLFRPDLHHHSVRRRVSALQRRFLLSRQSADDAAHALCDRRKPWADPRLSCDL
jgi:hypothetical protein